MDFKNADLEWIGDSILGLVVREFLAEHLPYQANMSRDIAFQRFASNKALKKVGEKLGFSNHHRMADEVEVLIGKVYQTYGFTVAAMFIHEHILTQEAWDTVLGYFKDDLSKINPLALDDLTYKQKVSGYTHK